MVSDWYEDFAPVSDQVVLQALDPARAPRSIELSLPDTTDERGVDIQTDMGVLGGDLGVPDQWTAPGTPARGLVIFAHGGGSSRQSYRNRFLAGWLRVAGWATLRLDLLLAEEQAVDLTTGVHRFDVGLIGRRLTSAVDWAVRQKVPGSENIVLFGASTGAAAAVIAAAGAAGWCAWCGCTWRAGGPGRGGAEPVARSHSDDCRRRGPGHGAPGIARRSVSCGGTSRSRSSGERATRLRRRGLLGRWERTRSTG